MKNIVFTFLFVVLGAILVSEFAKSESQPTKTFKVECKSFDFDGEVYRDGKKFYELIGGKEIWIPLGDCLLRETE